MIYAIGDIHGQHQKLLALLSQLRDAGMRDDDRLVFVGDYVDRGPDVAGLLDHLITLKASRPRTVFLRGNHEQMMLDARARYDPSFDSDNSCGNTELGPYWFAEGGDVTLRSYGKVGLRRWYEVVPDEHWQFMLSTRLQFEEDGYLFVHAGIVPFGVHWSLGEFDVDPRLWIRDEFIFSPSTFGGRTVIFGHTPTTDGKPIIMANKVAIDTGAGYGRPLTAVGLPTPFDPAKVEVWQA